MRIDSHGRITLPRHIRGELGLEPGDEVDIIVDNGVANIVPRGPRGRGARIVAALRGRGDTDLTTDEIMAMTRGEQLGSSTINAAGGPRPGTRRSE